MNYKEKRLIKSNYTLDKYFTKNTIQKAEQNDKEKVKKIKVPLSSGLPPYRLPQKIALKYPKNPQIRGYQEEIVKQCIFYNTLVCLPTGLGKTHIAAIIMANFTRWFPQQKIIFLAPTKPLVNQQKSALKTLQQLVPKNTIVEITGKNLSIHRQQLYKNHKIIFATPKTIQNDIKNQLIKSKDIILLIFDQCHKSTGNSSYALIMKLMNSCETGFRVVGLSATPGYEQQKIQEVIQNLNISKMIYKDETDVDVKKHLHHKNKIEIQVSSTEIIKQALAYLDKFATKSLGILCQLKLVKAWIIQRGLAGISFFLIREQFNKNINYIENKQKSLGYMALNMICFLSRCRKALLQNGYETFRFMFFNQLLQNKEPKPEDSQYIQSQIISNKTIKPFDEQQQSNSEQLDDIYTFYSTSNKNKPDTTKSLLKSCSALINKCILQTEQYKRLQQMFIHKQSKKSMHPKLEHVSQILKRFFQEHKGKAMVFTQYKITVKQIKDYLEGIQSIKAQYFFGQSKTTIIKQKQEYSLQLKQKDQLQVIEKYKKGQINVLISTCIGEQGLDIGQVDCIICYDGGHSPIRSIQRYGRTGRKRDGYVYILLMEGKQAQQYENGKKKAQKMKKLLKKNQKFKFYSYNSCLFEQMKYIAIEQFDNQMVYEQSAKKQTKKTKKNKKQELQQSQNDHLQTNRNKADKKTKKAKHKSKNKDKQKIEQIQPFQNQQTKQQFKNNLLKRSSISNIVQKYNQNTLISQNQSQLQSQQYAFDQSQSSLQFNVNNNFNQSKQTQKQWDQDYPFRDTINNKDELQLQQQQNLYHSQSNTSNKQEQQLLNISQICKQSTQLISQFINNISKQPTSKYNCQSTQIIQQDSGQYNPTQQLLQYKINKQQQQFYRSLLESDYEGQKDKVDMIDHDGGEVGGRGNGDGRSDMENNLEEIGQDQDQDQQYFQMIKVSLDNAKREEKNVTLIDYQSLLEDL